MTQTGLKVIHRLSLALQESNKVENPHNWSRKQSPSWYIQLWHCHLPHCIYIPFWVPWGFSQQSLKSQLLVPQIRVPSHSWSESQSPSPSLQKPITPLLQEHPLQGPRQSLSAPQICCSGQSTSLVQVAEIKVCVHSLNNKRNIKCSMVLEIDLTRFGPNRPAADTEGNGEFDFWGFLETFLRIFGDFLRNSGEIGSLREDD